jgi:hypothetical protein
MLQKKIENKEFVPPKMTGIEANSIISQLKDQLYILQNQVVILIQKDGGDLKMIYGKILVKLTVKYIFYS